VISESALKIGSKRYRTLQVRQQRSDIAQAVSDIDSHGGGAVEVFPSAPSPKPAATRIIFRDQNIRALQAGTLQTGDTFIDQPFAKSESLTRGIDCQVINISPSAIVTAQHRANDCRSFGCHAAQASILFQESPDCFPIVALRNVQTFDPAPEFDSPVVIFDAKLPCLNLHLGRF
jgi:hypothetical protein